MLRIGIIGAGNITKRHIAAYQSNPECEVVAIADINPEQAEKTATEFGIKNIYTEYHHILNDDTIDAVSIATPTFTHKDIALDAIRSNKHVLCEKPPAMSACEVKEIQNALKGSSKVFMFGLVRRFSSYVAYLKDYIDSGKMGQIISAEAVRVSQMTSAGGWFAKRSLGGGALRDTAIHELDSVLYLMGYPKAKTVSAYESRINNELYPKIKSKKSAGYATADKNTYQKDTEDIIQALITLDNDACIIVKSGDLFLSHKTGCYYEITGERAGALTAPFDSEKPLEIIEVTDDMYMNQSTPVLPDTNIFAEEINHFVDCCINDTPCAVKVEEAVALMEIIDAIYKSAETGEPIIMN